MPSKLEKDRSKKTSSGLYWPCTKVWSMHFPSPKGCERGASLFQTCSNMFNCSKLSKGKNHGQTTSILQVISSDLSALYGLLKVGANCSISPRGETLARAWHCGKQGYTKGAKCIIWNHMNMYCMFRCLQLMSCLMFFGWNLCFQ